MGLVTLEFHSEANLYLLGALHMLPTRMRSYPITRLLVSGSHSLSEGGNTHISF